MRTSEQQKGLVAHFEKIAESDLYKNTELVNYVNNLKISLSDEYYDKLRGKENKLYFKNNKKESKAMLLSLVLGYALSGILLTSEQSSVPPMLPCVIGTIITIALKFKSELSIQNIVNETIAEEVLDTMGFINEFTKNHDEVFNNDGYSGYLLDGDNDDEPTLGY